MDVLCSMPAVEPERKDDERRSERQESGADIRKSKAATSSPAETTFAAQSPI